jgi:hypothetical protein
VTAPDYSLPLHDEEERLLNDLFVRSRTGVPGDPEALEFRAADQRRLLAEFLARRDEKLILRCIEVAKAACDLAASLRARSGG